MKKYEKNKAAIVEVLTDLADAISSAEISDDTQLASALGGGCQDSRYRRLRVLYIQLACDIINFLHRD